MTIWSAFFATAAERLRAQSQIRLGQFINNLVARRHIAIDSWPGFAAYLAPV
jgi:hypothetical protein